MTHTISDITEQPTDVCPLFEPELHNLETPADITAYLVRKRAEINSPAVLERDGVWLLGQNSALIDAALRHIYNLAVQRATASAPNADIPSIAIIATGGYGRREMAPYSDVDVTFIPSREDDSVLNAIIKDMFQSVMDIFLYGADMKVGYAYRYVGDRDPLDHQTQTALLDSRLLCGDRELFMEFRSKFRSRLLTADFIYSKCAERRGVLVKNGGETVRSVEPNIKEGCGGLRDLQNAEWISEVIFRTSRSKVWNVLVDRCVVSREAADAALAAGQFLWTVRAALHIASGQQRDILTFEKQEAVAHELGYRDIDDVPAVELFMRDYYSHAVHVRRISQRIIDFCLDSDISLGLGLASRNRVLVVSDSDAADSDAALPLHMVELAHAYDLKVTAELEDRITEFISRHPEPVDPLLAGSVFTRILSSGYGVAGLLRRLESEGVLAWLIPDFDRIMNLIPYDAAHDFTVGEHSLRVVENIDGLRGSTDSKLADFHRIITEISNPEILLLAGLLHDIGKQWPDEGGHSESGARAAGKIAEYLGWDKERRSRLMFLVRHHLLMAETSRFRDLSLTSTLRVFEKQIPDMDALNMLYILTYADTRAVGEGVWTDVQGRFLTELYYRAEAAIASRTAEAVVPAFVPNLTRQRERIRKQLSQHDLPIDLIHEHTRNLPAQYLLNTPLEDMYLHIAMVGRLRDTYKPIVDFRHDFGSEFTEVTIVTFDDPKPGLLAKITGILYAHDINLHIAQVFTREASVPIAIDTLWIDFRGKPLTTTKKAEVQDSLRLILTGEKGIGELLQTKKKPLKEQAIYAAKIDDASSDLFSVLEVSAPDEKGVVYRLSRAISSLGWDIHAARISVWGSRARDAFYITDAQGVKIKASDVTRLTEALPIIPFHKRRLHGG
jgi:[protein-PII] uridylyltransferase